ncbi:unnamed protein product [Danaus chrysippus]|uniref:(African queen) hypothetical protein n=1 Tax=Danaus chrysippus TaxID=151541 RepID=A0A8J2RI80_9NEOP|nr:unnamed protein product [Danaus chrysippus]
MAIEVKVETCLEVRVVIGFSCRFECSDLANEALFKCDLLWRPRIMIASQTHNLMAIIRSPLDDRDDEFVQQW